MRLKENSARDVMAAGMVSIKRAESSTKSKQSSMADEFFKGVGFCVGREGLELYVKTIN